MVSVCAKGSVQSLARFQRSSTCHPSYSQSRLVALPLLFVTLRSPSHQRYPFSKYNTTSAHSNNTTTTNVSVSRSSNARYVSRNSAHACLTTRRANFKVKCRLQVVASPILLLLLRFSAPPPPLRVFV